MEIDIPGPTMLSFFSIWTFRPGGYPKLINQPLLTFSTISHVLHMFNTHEIWESFENLQIVAMFLLVFCLFLPTLVSFQ